MATIPDKLKENVIIFIDELIDQFPNDATLILTRIFVDKVDPLTIIDTISKEIKPYKERIKNRDDKFFLNNTLSIFNNVDTGKVDKLKTMWLSDRLDDNDRDVIWAWIDSFILLIDKYEKMK